MSMHLRRFVQLFIALGSKNYAKANINNLRVLKYHQEHQNLPFDKVFRRDIGAFDEEAGEVAFACLGRFTQGDHTQDKLKHCDRMWKTLSMFNDKKDFLDPANVRSRPSGRKQIQPSCLEVRTVTHFVKRKIRELERGVYVWYSSDVAYKKTGHAARISTDEIPTVNLNVQKRLKQMLVEMKKKWPHYWAEEFYGMFNYVPPQIGFVVQPRAGSVGAGAESPPQPRRRSPRRLAAPKRARPAPPPPVPTAPQPEDAQPQDEPADDDSCSNLSSDSDFCPDGPQSPVASDAAIRNRRRQQSPRRSPRLNQSQNLRRLSRSSSTDVVPHPSRRQSRSPSVAVGDSYEQLFSQTVARAVRNPRVRKKVIRPGFVSTQSPPC
jgi:hypothetical protein